MLIKKKKVLGGIWVWLPTWDQSVSVKGGVGVL